VALAQALEELKNSMGANLEGNWNGKKTIISVQSPSAGYSESLLDKIFQM